MWATTSRYSSTRSVVLISTWLTTRSIRVGSATEDTFWGLEAATLWGPFSLQGEYAHLDVDLPNGAFIPSNPPGADS